MPHPFDRLSRAAAPMLAGIVALSFAVAADNATAQTGNQPQVAPPQSSAGQKPGAAQGQGEPVDAKLAEIKKQLNITAAQQPQFDKFADTVKKNAQEMDALMQKMLQAPQQNAVEGLRTAATFAQTEADNLKRLAPAFEALYATLSDQQKRSADKLFNTAAPSGQPQGRRG